MAAVALEARDTVAVGAGWRTRAGRLVAAACLATFALHLLFLAGPLLPDEGGYAIVARWWSEGGSSLYGDQWVDRPPVLIAVFQLADALGPWGVRIMAGVFATAFVALVAWAGWAVRGPRAAVWAAWTAFGLMNMPLMQTFALNGELVAATWTMASVAAVIHGVRRTSTPGGATAAAAVAGCAAALAVLTKQNFVDAAVFAAVLVGALAARGGLRGRVTAIVAGLLGGFLVPVVLAGAWSAANGAVSDLIYAMYGFRADAAETMARSSSGARMSRFRELGLIWVGSGMGVLAATVVITRRDRLRRLSPLPLAAAACALVEAAGVLLGGNYWPHYLIGMVPMTVLVVGVAAADPGRGRVVTRRLVVVIAAVAAVVSPIVAVAMEVAPQPAQAIGRWLSDVSEPSDTVVVLYSHPNVIEASGLQPAYPYSWNLPIRTRDPRLDLLEETLQSDAAPTWVVGWDPLRAWGLDDDRRLEQILSTRYTLAATICGRPVWLRDGVSRAVGTPPTC